MEIFVIRHGLTELNKKGVVNGQIDEPLAAEGVEQTRAAITLIPESIKYIYSSPFLRTRQTAEIINSDLKRPITYQAELGEIHMGSLAGKAWTEMEQGLDLKRKHRSIQFDYHPYGGESADDVKKRVLKLLRDIRGRHVNREVLIVTHGGIIRTLHLLESGQPLIDEIEHISLHTVDLNKILR